MRPTQHIALKQPLLVAVTRHAVPDLHVVAVGLVSVGEVEAFIAVDHQVAAVIVPLLVVAARAIPQLHKGAVGLADVADIETLVRVENSGYGASTGRGRRRWWWSCPHELRRALAVPSLYNILDSDELEASLLKPIDEARERCERLGLSRVQQDNAP
jgi:hypothetical protein